MNLHEQILALPLPQPHQITSGTFTDMPFYTADQMREYAAAALVASEVKPGPVSDQNARYAIDEVIERGRHGVNPPPTDDHWLMPYWKMGRQLAASEAQGEQKPVDLPPLPAPEMPHGSRDFFSASQMHAYVMADRENRAQASPTAEDYSDMLREHFFRYAAGGYNSEGLVGIDAAKSKLEWIVDDQKKPVASGTIPRRVLIDVRNSLQSANNSPVGGISDTIWMKEHPETLFDFIDAALADHPYDPGNPEHTTSSPPAPDQQPFGYVLLNDWRNDGWSLFKGGTEEQAARMRQTYPTVHMVYTTPQPPADERLREALSVAYGYLWHVNAGMDAPAECGVLSVSPERAAYEARKVLREFLTHEQRGQGINAARAALAAMPPAPGVKS